MKPAMLVLSAIVLIFFLAASLTAINDFRTEDRTEYHDTTTAAGTTSANVTLAQDLYDDATRHVTSITSNETADAPIAFTYTAATNVLLVTGLDDSNTSRLTVVYEIDALEGYYAATQGTSALPVLLLLGIIGIVAGGIYAATTGKG